MIDFVKDGYEGCAVEHPAYGKGLITCIHEDDPYPVGVTFENGRFIIFNALGKSDERDLIPLLQYSNGTFCIDQGEPDWKPTEASWAQVRNSKTKDLSVRFIVKYKSWLRLPYVDSTGASWRDATPCEAPEWQGNGSEEVLNA